MSLSYNSTLVNKITSDFKNGKKEEAINRRKINILKNDITIKENELNIMKNRYEHRVVNSYLKGRISDLEKVLSSTSWRQAVYRTQYLKIISSIEQKMTKEIENLLLKINKDRLQLESLLRQSIALKREKQKQMLSLRKMRI